MRLETWTTCVKRLWLCTELEEPTSMQWLIFASSTSEWSRTCFWLTFTRLAVGCWLVFIPAAFLHTHVVSLSPLISLPVLSEYTTDLTSYQKMRRHPSTKDQKSRPPAEWLRNRSNFHRMNFTPHDYVWHRSMPGYPSGHMTKSGRLTAITVKKLVVEVYSISAHSTHLQMSSKCY